MMKKKVAVQSCKKLVYGGKNQLVQQARLYHTFLWKIGEALTFMVVLSQRRFQAELNIS